MFQPRGHRAIIRSEFKRVKIVLPSNFIVEIPLLLVNSNAQLLVSSYCLRPQWKSLQITFAHPHRQQETTNSQNANCAGEIGICFNVDGCNKVKKQKRNQLLFQEFQTTEGVTDISIEGQAKQLLYQRAKISNLFSPHDR